MGLNRGQQIDYAALELRRLEAGRLFRKGLSQIEIALKLRVRPASVCRWHQAWQQGGLDALKRKGRAGRRFRLSASQLKLLKSVISADPASDEWTLERIGKLIHKRFGISYHPGHVWRILRQIGWRARRPMIRGKGQDKV